MAQIETPAWNEKIRNIMGAYGSEEKCIERIEKSTGVKISQSAFNRIKHNKNEDVTWTVGQAIIFVNNMARRILRNR